MAEPDKTLDYVANPLPEGTRQGSIVISTVTLWLGCSSACTGWMALQLAIKPHDVADALFPFAVMIGAAIALFPAALFGITLSICSAKNGRALKAKAPSWAFLLGFGTTMAGLLIGTANLHVLAPFLIMLIPATLTPIFTRVLPSKVNPVD